MGDHKNLAKVTIGFSKYLVQIWCFHDLNDGTNEVNFEQKPCCSVIFKWVINDFWLYLVHARWENLILRKTKKTLYILQRGQNSKLIQICKATKPFLMFSVWKN